MIHSLVTEVCVDDEYDEVSDEASDESRNVTKRTAGDDFRYVTDLLVNKFCQKLFSKKLVLLLNDTSVILCLS